MTDKTRDTSLWTHRSTAETQKIYADWAASYDDDVTALSYATPDRVAQALLEQHPTLDDPILDFGCGTGLSGLALRKAGFQTLDGTDISPEMLAQARDRSHDTAPLYRTTWLGDPGGPTFAVGSYKIIVATGVISLGAAPPSLLNDLLDRLPTEGLLAFSYNDPTLADDSYINALDTCLHVGKAQLVFSRTWAAPERQGHGVRRDRPAAQMITRFAPSPTGPLHLGHAYSALLAHDMAISTNGQFLLRIEDIDQSRARPAWEAQIYDDLAWLGLTWDAPVWRQSDRLATYQDTLTQLWDQGLVFACTCNRRDIEAALAAPQEGAALAHGPDGLIYPGTCRHRTSARNADTPPQNSALRLNLSAPAQCDP